MVVEDPNRSVKIIDPQTFKEITPPNYKHYRFISPDGKLYAKLSTKTRSINIIKNEELTEDKVIKCRYELDMPSNIIQKEMLDISKNRVEKNRKQFYEEYTLEFNKIGIHDSSNINSNAIIRVVRFIEIGIVGTEVIAKIAIPEDLSFYNYAAFSYDNKFFGYVGKPTFNGLIHLFKIGFEEVNSKLIIIDSYLSRLPTRASWVCGFSKTGYFATYDSIPDTYILQVDDETFKNKTSEFDLRQNIYTSKVNLYHTYKKWNVIKGKNFLCFSPTGKFLALSEQGYDPLTINGYGHQESNAVHIAQTKSGKIINSFIGHGEQIKNNKTKKVAFVAFSDDESRIMTLSTDGVVFIRDLKIKN
jgi:WD40 repeat protein